MYLCDSMNSGKKNLLLAVARLLLLEKINESNQSERDPNDDDGIFYPFASKRINEKIFADYGIESSIINSRLINSFTNLHLWANESIDFNDIE